VPWDTGGSVPGPAAPGHAVGLSRAPQPQTLPVQLQGRRAQGLQLARALAHKDVPRAAEPGPRRARRAQSRGCSGTSGAPPSPPLRKGTARRRPGRHRPPAQALPNAVPRGCAAAVSQPGAQHRSSVPARCSAPQQCPSPVLSATAVSQPGAWCHSSVPAQCHSSVPAWCLVPQQCPSPEPGDAAGGSHWAPLPAGPARFQLQKQLEMQFSPRPHYRSK